MPKVLDRPTIAVTGENEEAKEDSKQIKFSGEDMKNVVEFKDTDSARGADAEIEAFKKDNIVNSSICDGLIMKDMSSTIKMSCVGRRVKIGRNVQIINSVIMSKVTIGDDVKIVNSLVCSGSKIGNGQIVKDGKLGFKTQLHDLKEDIKAETPMQRRPSLLKME